MRNAIVAFITTLLLSIVGMIIDSNIGLDGNFGVIVAIDVMGSFLLYSLDKHNTK